MDKVWDFLYYELIAIESVEFVLAPINILMIAGVILAAYVGLKLYHRSLVRFSDKSKIIEKRSDMLLKITKQITYVVSTGLIIQSFSVNNKNIHFPAFLETQILKIDKFELDVYHIILGIFLFFAAKLFLNFFKLYLDRNLSKKDWVDEGKEFTIYQLAKYFVYIIIVIILVRSTGVQMSLLITGAAAFFVSIGLGLQSTFADMVSGFLLLFDGAVKVGDIIEIEGQVTRVKKINIRTTRLATLDDSVLVIPNSHLTRERVENRSNKRMLSRYKVTVSVAYGSDTLLVKDLLLQAAKSHKNVSTTKRPKVFFENFGDSGLQFDLFFWTDKDMLNMKIKSDLRFEIDRLLGENDIVIPFPQRDLHIKSGLTEFVEKRSAQ